MGVSALGRCGTWEDFRTHPGRVHPLGGYALHTRIGDQVHTCDWSAEAEDHAIKVFAAVYRGGFKSGCSTMDVLPQDAAEESLSRIAGFFRTNSMLKISYSHPKSLAYFRPL